MFRKRVDILFDILLNTSFKMATNFANVARITASTSKFYSRKYFKALGTGSLYAK